MTKHSKTPARKPTRLLPPLPVDQQLAWIDRLDRALEWNAADWLPPFSLGRDCRVFQGQLRLFREGLLMGARLAKAGSRK